jgi:hypothetical protein
MNLNKKEIQFLIERGLKKIKDETKEATGSGSAGGFTPSLSMWSEDNEAKNEYKRMDQFEGEFTEATGSGSVGAYDAPGFEDVKMRGNNPVGRGKQFKKPLYQGGGFVTFKKGCKTFTYCSQGNSKDKPVRVSKKLSPIEEAINNVSTKTGLSVEEIKKIIVSKF